MLRIVANTQFPHENPGSAPCSTLKGKRRTLALAANTVINQKYGFADRHGKIVIAPRYGGAFPFLHGYGMVWIGCREHA
jgi:hypothetical protein